MNNKILFPPLWNWGSFRISETDDKGANSRTRDAPVTLFS